MSTLAPEVPAGMEIARFTRPISDEKPAGEWLRIALEVADKQRVGFFDRTRLFALATIAMSDVVAPTFTSKFLYQHWRPATAIREADTDGNPLTEQDAS